VRTPEVFLLDEKRVIRYHGRIDDQYGVGYIRENAKRLDLKEAIDELLAEKEVSVSSTRAVGCFIGRIREPDPDAKVTYSNQIARLLQRRCVECHREGEIAPFTLTDYDEVVGWAETIAEVVENRRMPPWHAAAEHGKFANARRLSDSERQLIYDWVDAGAPEGDPAQLPKPVTFVKGWQLPRKPDFVIAMGDKPFTIKAEGAIKYQYFRVDPGFTEDKWVAAAQAVPGNRAVVHHILVFVKPPGGKRKFEQLDSDFLAGYVPGQLPRPFPKGMAKLIPAGSELVFQMHYTPIGSVQQDISKVGLIFADPKEIDHVVLTTKAANGGFVIPPQSDERAGNYPVEATSRPAPPDVKLLGFMPHMHVRGKSFRYEAIVPDKDKPEILLDVPQYDFNWQTAYQLAEPILLPKGTRIHCIAHYNNTETNLSNPNPDISVRWGDQTWEEMMIGYFDVAVPVDPENLPKGAVPRAAKRLNPRGVLNRYDANGDGKVARDEVPEKLHRLFDRLDRNGDKTLTLEELKKASEKK
jgi:hypothetical protein